MHFDWSFEQEHLFERTLTFARTRLAPRERPPTSACHTERWRLMGHFGILGVVTPEEYGGMGLDTMSTARVLEALGLGCEDLGFLFMTAAHLFACVEPICEYGDADLKRRLLPGLSSGSLIGANAITEAGAGSDVASLRTRARRDGDVYILDGTKSYVTNAPVADVFLVYATQNPAHGYLGISAFVVERDAPGLRVGPAMETIGLESAPIGQLYLQDCRVPARNLLGPEGRGSAVFAHSMHVERTCLFALYLGAMQRVLERSIARALERRLVGRRYQAVRHRLVDMKLRLEAARLLLYRACWARDQGERATLDVALAKLAVSEAAVQNSLDCFDILGQEACAVDAGFERALRDALPSTIVSGTSEIQRELVARELGL